MAENQIKEKRKEKMKTCLNVTTLGKKQKNFDLYKGIGNMAWKQNDLLSKFLFAVR